MEPESPDLVKTEHQVEQYLDIPDYPNGSMSDPLERQAREMGCRVVLSGLIDRDRKWRPRQRSHRSRRLT